ncbi:MAG: UDP-N-acetylmuramate:L-alanyl-gamma-D-glutamyl-meso-diaminopimelate ligase [Desulfobacterales bacterium]
MDPSLNTIPPGARRVHLIGVCGTAMGALACMLQDLGCEVSGSDQKIYPPMSDFLAGRGIRVMEGFRPENLGHCPELVVVGNVVTRVNPEAVELDRLGLAYCSMPQAIHRFATAGKRTLMVTGTHGKTTTCAILAWVLEVAGRKPSFVIGGILKNFGRNYGLGGGDLIVLEGDEYDTAFFDKGPKFLHYTPQATVITGVEFDHADIYRDLAHVKSAFRRLAQGLPAESLLVVWDDDANVSEVIDATPASVQRYGLRQDSPWRLDGVEIEPPWTIFGVQKRGQPFGRFRTRLIGAHNLLNALAAIAVADHIAVPAASMTAALESFEGVKRRQEIRGERRGVTVMDDFAHHPTAVRETLAAVRSSFPGRRIVAVFEPRTNTSMRKVFQAVYPAAFDAADLVLIRRPSMIAKVPEPERFSSEALAAALAARGKPAWFFAETGEIIDHLVDIAVPGDVVVIMSNGGFDNIHERLLASL